MDWQAITLTAKLAGITTLILAVFGVPLAWWLARARKRYTLVVDALVGLPMVLPPTVLGFYVLVALGPNSPLGSLYEGIAGHILPFTFESLVIASVLYSLPFAVRPFTAAFAAVDGRLLDVSRSLGRGPLYTFTRVALPLSAPGVVSGLVLAFVHTVGEFGVVLMVGGSIAGETRTISISLYDDVQSLDYARAHETAAALLAFSFVALCVTYALQPKGRQL
ncbi:MAG: molybdate ABC transporter permease subunit [Planctomycetes bacterium]|nr:molybdate ABC transporter permease subunit [Planctomycetota bacterium]MCW8135862.1 molybdate ABC transporter permease subunit [Planctomycetota bacterium]